MGKWTDNRQTIFIYLDLFAGEVSTDVEELGDHRDLFSQVLSLFLFFCTVTFIAAFVAVVDDFFVEKKSSESCFSRLKKKSFKKF